MKKTDFFIAIGMAIVMMLFSASRAEAISWRNDLDGALSSAQNSGEPIMVDFYTDWCGWCKKLDSDTYSDDAVDTLSRDFICVKVNGDSERELTGKYNVRGYPTIIFLNSKGNVIGSHVGYVGPADLARTMEGILKNTAASKTEAASASKNNQAVPIVNKAPVQAEKTKETFDIDEFKRDAAKKIKKMQNHNLQLDGILLDPKPPKAIINNKIVKVGDTIEGATVTAIEADKVELSLGQGEKITLKME